MPSAFYDYLAARTLLVEHHTDPFVILDGGMHAGKIGLDGQFPANTSGTGLSWGYLMGFTQLTEGIRQMRGEGGACQVKDAETCLVTGLGGMVDNGSAATCCILRR